MSIAGAIRSVVFKRTGSIASTILVKRDISIVTFDQVNEYKKQPKKRQDAIQKTVKFAKIAGLDGAGAEIATLPGGFHDGGVGVDKFSRLTATVKNKDGNQLYFYRTSDGTFWERVHIPEDPAIWPTKAIYIGISKTDFDKRVVLEYVSVKDKFAVIVYEPKLINVVSEVASKEGSPVACFVGYGSFASPSLTIPIVLHLTANAPRPDHPPSDATTIFTYRSTSPFFVLPRSAHYDAKSAILAHSRTLQFIQRYLLGQWNEQDTQAESV